jgi:predicted membrane protein
MEMNQNSKRTGNSHLGLGLVLILAGILLLAGKFGFIPYPVYNVLLSWPMIFVAIAVVNFVKREIFPGMIFLAVGTFFMLPDLLPDVSTREIMRFWPVLLIFGGILFIFRRKQSHPFHVETTDNHEVIDEVNVFGGGVTNVSSSNFKGGKITCVFGGGEMNFANSKLSETGAIIDMVAVFGGMKIMVPRDWTVKVEVVSVFGGFSDKRIYMGEPGSSQGKTLLIKGVNIFGGGELRSI